MGPFVTQPYSLLAHTTSLKSSVTWGPVLGRIHQDLLRFQFPQAPYAGLSASCDLLDQQVLKVCSRNSGASPSPPLVDQGTIPQL